jgi:ABC-type multidrug transport system ATPase subunit
MSKVIASAHEIAYYDQLKPSTFNLEKGFTTLMGPSGSGKSTCAQLLIGALIPTQGEIKHYSENGEEVLRISPESKPKFIDRFRLETTANRNIKSQVIKYFGYVAQNPELPPDMTVNNYIYDVRTSAGNSLDRVYVESLLSRLGIENQTNCYAKDQSGGQQQKTAMAFALANKPSLLIADEPNASLDIESGEEVLKLTRELANSGMSVLWITHTPEHQEYADHRLFARDGTIYGGL